MRREKRKWRPHERESTDAGHRGGVACNSDEGSVMELEPRSDIVQLYDDRTTRDGRILLNKAKPFTYPGAAG